MSDAEARAGQANVLFTTVCSVMLSHVFFFFWIFRFEYDWLIDIEIRLAFRSAAGWARNDGGEVRAQSARIETSAGRVRPLSTGLRNPERGGFYFAIFTSI